MKKIRTASLAGIAAGACFILAMSAATAAPVPLAAAGDVAGAASSQSMLETVRYRGARVGAVRGGRGYYRGGRGYYRGGRWGGGAALGAGLAAGLIGGALLGGGPAYAAPEPVYEPAPVYVRPRGGDAVEYCMQRYRSYDPNTGTYIGLDGRERSCP